MCRVEVSKGRFFQRVRKWQQHSVVIGGSAPHAKGMFIHLRNLGFKYKDMIDDELFLNLA
ncbi:hypothetical protein [Vibrio salilacus]|uniref:hypothetical protein n=1 Tax=Vibrio salilacus TaxID=1323749 RepID=UPI001FE2CE27|nr:hypothetical protein [Vibrio salilacus]